MDIESNNLLLVEIKHLIRTEDMDIWNYKNELTTLIDEAIARQSVTSEEVQEAIVILTEWRDFLSGTLPADAEGTREIMSYNLAITALQAYQPKDACEDVVKAIELFDGAIKYRKDQEEEVKKHYGGKLPDFYLDLNRKEALAIAALQAYQPTTRKDRTVEEVDISKTETTSAKKIVVDIQLRPMLDELEVDIDDIKAYISKLD